MKGEGGEAQWRAPWRMIGPPLASVVRLIRPAPRLGGEWGGGGRGRGAGGARQIFREDTEKDGRRGVPLITLFAARRT